MNMSPVSRLKKTWAKVKTAKFDILEVCQSHVSESNGESRVCLWSQYSGG